MLSRPVLLNYRGECLCSGAIDVIRGLNVCSSLCWFIISLSLSLCRYGLTQPDYKISSEVLSVSLSLVLISFFALTSVSIHFFSFSNYFIHYSPRLPYTLNSNSPISQTTLTCSSQLESEGANRHTTDQERMGPTDEQTQ